jgi:cysteine desulfurase
MSSREFINLDHNATTPPRPEVIEEVARVMREAWGNPGSRHAAGRRARQVLESSRERLAALMGARPDEVIFTSGGTESTHLALRGLTAGRPGVIAAPLGEHPATEETLRALAAEGWRRHTLPIDGDGILIEAELDHIPWPETRLVTLLLAHNETGVIQETSALSAKCAAHRVPLHLDAVQAVGKIEVDFTALGATTLSLGAHKFRGPRGVGALLVRRGTRLAPALRGGHQEQGHRPGTEPVPLIAGMVLALELWHRERDRFTRIVTALRQQLWSILGNLCPPVRLVGHPERRLLNTLNVAFPGCDGEGLLVALDLADVGCSLGSTCASGSAEVAPILLAMGLDPALARATLRFSLGATNTAAEIEDAARRIAAVVNQHRQTLGNRP